MANCRFWHFVEQAEVDFLMILLEGVLKENIGDFFKYVLYFDTVFTLLG